MGGFPENFQLYIQCCKLCVAQVLLLIPACEVLVASGEEAGDASDSDTGVTKQVASQRSIVRKNVWGEEVDDSPIGVGRKKKIPKKSSLKSASVKRKGESDDEAVEEVVSKRKERKRKNKKKDDERKVVIVADPISSGEAEEKTRKRRISRRDVSSD